MFFSVYISIKGEKSVYSVGRRVRIYFWKGIVGVVVDDVLIKYSREGKFVRH